MLKMTAVKLKKNILYLFIEKWLRRGISSIAKSNAKGNNKYMKNYDATKLSEFTTNLIWIICMVGQWVDIFLMVDVIG